MSLLPVGPNGPGLFTAAVLAVALSGCGAEAAEPAASARLVSTLLGERFTAGRLAGQDAWQSCEAPADPFALIPLPACGERLRPGTERFDSIAAAARDVEDAGGDAASPGTLRAKALLDLRWHGRDTTYLSRSIEALELARRPAPDDPVVLNDLAVAYLELGGRRQELVPMLQALDAVERALAGDPGMVAALFNRALVLERLYLLGSAQRAWSRYLSVEQDPRWKAEAEEHLHRLRRGAGPVSWKGVRESPPAVIDDPARAGIAGRVVRSPQAAREFSFRLFEAWGSAVLGGDHVRAARLLAVARVIAGAAEARGADRSVALALRTVDGLAADPARLRALAEAHVELAAGLDLFFQPNYEDAARTLAGAERALGSLGSPAARWAVFYRAAAEMNLGHHSRADSLLRRARAAATAAEPGLAGKATMTLGVNQLRQGNYERAIRFYHDALPFFARAKEADNEASIAYVASEALLLAGQTPAGRTEAFRGLRLLSRFRQSGFLNNHLTIVSLYARRDSLGYAALAMMNEVLEVAHAVGKPDVLAWAFRARARERIALGRHEEARADLEEAMRWVGRIKAGRGRDRVRADVMLVRGQMLRDRDPRAAFDTLSEVVSIYRRVGIGMHLPTGLFEAAQTAEKAGDPASARSLLDEAVRAIERQQETYQSAEIRASRSETVENIYDAMIRIELGKGRSASAFEYLERSRTAAWPRGERPPSADPAPGSRALSARIGARLPADMLFIDYALLSDRLVIWTASRGRWREHTVAVSRDTVAALVARFLRETSDPRVGADDVRSRLFDLLIGPVARELEGVRRLTIVPDRELSRLPFAALWDRKTRRYVVESYEVRTVPSADFVLSAAAGSRPVGAGASALVVGNPRVDTALARTLPDLPGAAREAGLVAGLYGSGRVLTGADARRHAVLAELPRVSVFHFAGHAVFDTEYPERSYLALASGDTAGILPAWEIGGLRLSNVRVVVLSACSTLNPRPSRAGPSAGLAYSFLRAGAPATISTLWDVTDGLTAQVVVEFHRRLARGSPSAEALRQAQIAALRDPRTELHAPAAWAAFVYTGP